MLQQMQTSCSIFFATACRKHKMRLTALPLAVSNLKSAVNFAQSPARHRSLSPKIAVRIMLSLRSSFLLEEPKHDCSANVKHARSLAPLTNPPAAPPAAATLVASGRVGEDSEGKEGTRTRSWGSE